MIYNAGRNYLSLPKGAFEQPQSCERVPSLKNVPDNCQQVFWQILGHKYYLL